MRIKIILVILGVFIITKISIGQSRKLNWGIAAPVLTTSDSKELGLSKNIKDNFMILFWGNFFYDKNVNIKSEQDLFEKFSFSVETELRKRFYKEKRINPYIGVAFKYGYEREEERYKHSFLANNEFIIKKIFIKQAGLAFSFGAEYFITQAVSIFTHTKIFNIYYTWNHDLFEDANLIFGYVEGVDKNYGSIKLKGFERSTLYIRFYF